MNREVEAQPQHRLRNGLLVTAICGGLVLADFSLSGDFADECDDAQEVQTRVDELNKLVNSEDIIVHPQLGSPSGQTVSLDGEDWNFTTGWIPDYSDASFWTYMSDDLPNSVQYILDETRGVVYKNDETEPSGINNGVIRDRRNDEPVCQTEEIDQLHAVVGQVLDVYKTQ